MHAASPCPIVRFSSTSKNLHRRDDTLDNLYSKSGPCGLLTVKKLKQAPRPRMKVAASVVGATLATLSLCVPAVVSNSSDHSTEQMLQEASSSTMGISDSLLEGDGSELNLNSTSEPSGETNFLMGYSTENLTTSSSLATEEPLSDTSKDVSTENEESATDSTKQAPTDGTFTDEQKSIWIDRHNFFRVAGLPWAAGNMRRMNWDDSLAQDAATAAATCAAKTGPGLNVYESISTDPSTVLEDAIIAWVVQPAIAEIERLVPPEKDGDSVGAGLYNSYTQIIWSSTTGVGCAMADCSGGKTVACAYYPPGNDGTSPWFIHAAQATNCPSETTAHLGLCVIEGDSKNDPIAPIPNGGYTKQMYPDFVADIKEAILKAAKARDAPGAPRVIESFPSDSTKSLDSENYSQEGGPLQLDSPAGSLPESTELGGSTSVEDPGVVKPSSATGLSFQNEESPPSTELEESPSSTEAEQSPPSTELEESPSSTELEESPPITEAEQSPPSTETEEQFGDLMSLSQSKPESLALSTSESATTPNSGLSFAGIATIIAVGVAAVAAFAAFTSYRKKQEQQQVEEEFFDRVEII